MTDHNSNNKGDRGNGKRPITFYYILVIIALLIIQALFGSMGKDKDVEEIPYSRFTDLVEEKKVEKVRFEKGYYLVQLKPKNGEADGEGKVYKTGPWADDDLTKKLEDQGVEFGAEIPVTMNPVTRFLVGFMLPLFLFMFLGRLMVRNMTGNRALSFGKSGAKVYVKEGDSKTFDDVAGQDEAKDSLTEIIDFLDNAKKYEAIGAVCPKGVLLVGPPGTGKTLMARAVAGEADVPFFSISGSEFVELFVGMGAAKVRDLFKEAKKNAPCIVFIDEIDAIGKRRDTSGMGGNDEREQTLNQLLNEMDGFEGNSGVVILAGTNRPEILDPALTRPGRFDRQIRVELPDVRGREDILKVHARDVKTAPNIDYRHVAQMTAGASGADLANIMNEGALRAVRMGRRMVTTDDLVESVETVIAGKQKKNPVISKRDRWIIAYHEVGHALVAALQKFSAPVTKITIIPRTSGALGYTMQVDQEEKVLMTKEDIFQEITTLTGGRCSEELVFGTKTTGASNDIERATKLSRSMVTRFGMSDDFDFMALETSTNAYLGGGGELMAAQGTAADIDQKVKEILKMAHDKAYSILESHRPQLDEIASYLLDKETITGETFMKILKESLDRHGMSSLEELKEEADQFKLPGDQTSLKEGESGPPDKIGD